MKDKFIKKILAKDVIKKSRPSDEWHTIANKIEDGLEKKARDEEESFMGRLSLYKTPIGILTCLSVILVTVNIGELRFDENISQKEKVEIVRYLVEENISNGEADLYSWVE